MQLVTSLFSGSRSLVATGPPFGGIVVAAVAAARPDGINSPVAAIATARIRHVLVMPTSSHLRCAVHTSLPSTAMVERDETVLVVDFGAQYAQLIARRVRELNVYSEIVPHRITAAELAADPPAALILSGGPKSVHVDGAPSLDPAIYELGIPTFGICYGAQLIAQQLGGEVGRGMRGEYGRARLTLGDDKGELLAGLPAEQDGWMSHFDAVVEVPEGFVSTASTPDAPVAALENPDRKIWGVQFHPEVVHTPNGMEVLRRFVIDLAACRATWTMDSIIDDQIAAVRE